MLITDNMKHLTGFLALFLCATLPLYSAGLDDLTWTTTNGEVTITDCDTAASRGLRIPDTIEGNPVTSIGTQAFWSCKSVTSITIPDSVTSIGDDAFYNCSSLRSITFQGSAPDVSSGTFLNVAGGAIATVTVANLSSFGSEGESWNGLILNAFDPVVADLEAQLAEAIAERDARPTAEAFVAVEAEREAAIEERDARPTAEELAAVEAERDARFTEDQIRGLSADYTIGLNEAGNVQMKFNLFESADLSTFAPLTLNPDSVSVVDGSICLEFAPEDRAAFFRFSVE